MPSDTTTPRNTLLFASLITLAVFVLYYPTIDYGLVHCDDNRFVEDYAAFNANPDNIWASFQETHGTSYYFRPILHMSFIWDAQLGGTNPAPYHFTNVFLHTVLSVILFIFLIRLTYDSAMSFVFALFYSLHPLLTPGASWISGRADSLLTLFILFAFITLKRYYESEQRWMTITLLLLNALFYALALFTKEVGGVYPVVALAFILLFLKDKPLSGKSIMIASSWVLVVILWYAVRASAIADIDSSDTVGLDAIVYSYPAIWALLGKVFLPVKMISLSSFEAFSITSGVIMTFVLGAAYFLLGELRKTHYVFGAIWYLVFLFPTILVRIAYADDFFDYAEHRAYLPMIGIILMLIEIVRSQHIDFRKPVVIGIATAIIVAFAVRSFVYQQTFDGRVAYWTHMTTMYPYKSRGYLDLGKAYFATGELEKAEQLYHKGVERNPNNKNLYIDLCTVYLQQERYDKAELFGKKAVQLDPEDPLANYQLFGSFILRGMNKEALPYLEKACSRNDKFPKWFVQLGVMYADMKMYDQAIRAYYVAIQMDQNHSLAWSSLGATLAEHGKPKEAESAWLRAMQLNPNLRDPYVHLISYYLQSGEISKLKPITDTYLRAGGRLNDDVMRQLRELGSLPPGAP